MKSSTSIGLSSVLLLIGASVAGAEPTRGAKPCVPAPWLAAERNKKLASSVSTLGTTVYINMSGLSFAEGDRGALREFAEATKRYSQATRFAASWDTLMPEYHNFDRWVYDRNRQAVFRQSSGDGQSDWNGFCVTEPLGVTDEMIQRAAAKRNNTVFDLLRFGAINRRVYWKGVGC